MNKTRRNQEFARQRRRCPACGRWTVRKRRYLPLLDERCGPCVNANFHPMRTPPPKAACRDLGCSMNTSHLAGSQRSREDAHTCHAEGCDKHVPPRMFMCKPHWYKVPYGLRVAVWAAYEPGQERLDGTAFPSDEYLEVTREAIEAVAEKEGRRRAVPDQLALGQPDPLIPAETTVDRTAT